MQEEVSLADTATEAEPPTAASNRNFFVLGLALIGCGLLTLRLWNSPALRIVWPEATERLFVVMWFAPWFCLTGWLLIAVVVARARGIPHGLIWGAVVYVGGGLLFLNWWLGDGLSIVVRDPVVWAILITWWPALAAFSLGWHCPFMCSLLR